MISSRRTPGRFFPLGAALLALGVLASQRSAAETPLSQAVQRGLDNLQKAAAKYSVHRDCFSCHHQTLPLLALVTAASRGFAVDDKLLQAQAEFTGDSFGRYVELMKEGKGIGGRAMTVGYGLWALGLADWKANETTEAMVAYLLKTQRAEGCWSGQVSRPPLEESYLTCTVLAVQGMKRYAAAAQDAEVEAAIAKARTWLVKAPAKGQEDKAARLWGLHMLDGKPPELQAARQALVNAQREDGGWAQLDEMKSDAYATGQTLFVLQATGFETSEPAFQRGARFLLDTQRPDGAWLVASRSKPIQPYYAFDDEDPLGKNQFISVPATSWAVAALAAAMQSPAPHHPGGK
jgi:N-acyl-D-amino-acid deacylase